MLGHITISKSGRRQLLRLVPLAKTYFVQFYTIQRTPSSSANNQGVLFSSPWKKLRSKTNRTTNRNEQGHLKGKEKSRHFSHATNKPNNCIMPPFLTAFFFQDFVTWMSAIKVLKKRKVHFIIWKWKLQSPITKLFLFWVNLFHDVGELKPGIKWMCTHCTKVSSKPYYIQIVPGKGYYYHSSLDQ